MRHNRFPIILTALLAAAGIAGPGRAEGIAWPSWRGPQQNGTSLETDLPERWTVDGDNQRWTYELSGRGTPVIANGRVYALGYEGEGADLREVLVCLDERDGRPLWEHRFADFLSDSIYTRYAIGAPTVDPRNGNVYCMTTAGLMNAFSAGGELLWQHSMMEEFGRLTFPNGRTGAPVVDGDLVIVHGITVAWGALGPARDRFYAFESRTGRLVWASTPGASPVDSSFSFPVLEWRDGRRVLYATTGCGHVVAIDARTGAPLWRYPMSFGGMNSNVVIHGDELVAIHGKENRDASAIGRMVALKLGARPAPGEAGPVVLDRSSELWRNDLGAFTSSPVLVGDRVYQTVANGELCCVDVETGAVLWHERLGPDQIHASPVYGDGKLYVPMTNGSFYVIRPEDRGPTILSKTQLGGNCLGAPAIANGRVYVHTTERLYVFGREGGVTPAPVIAPIAARPTFGTPTTLLCASSDLLVQPGDDVPVTTWAVDAEGDSVGPVRNVTWTTPPSLRAAVTDNRLVVDEAAPGAAAVVEGTAYGLATSMRVRVAPRLPYREDFESTDLARKHRTEPGVMFEFPPSFWIGSKLKWEVRELDGGHVLAKTLDRALFQRNMSFFGHPDMSDYTMQVDIMSDGNRRTMSTAGLINQRYLILLKGNHQQIEISSNQERVKEMVPFRWRPNTWITLKSRVDRAANGTVIVRAKAWPRDETEPAAWNIEYVHADGHTHGSPGLFGFAPQSRFRVYVDNLMVTPNE